MCLEAISYRGNNNMIICNHALLVGGSEQVTLSKIHTHKIRNIDVEPWVSDRTN